VDSRTEQLEYEREQLWNILRTLDKSLIDQGRPILGVRRDQLPTDVAQIRESIALCREWVADIYAPYATRRPPVVH
jgi:hypothetical protein